MDEEQKPWEKYSGPQEQGPWSKYGGSPAPAPEPAPEKPGVISRFGGAALESLNPLPTAQMLMNPSSAFAPRVQNPNYHPPQGMIEKARTFLGGNQPTMAQPQEVPIIDEALHGKIPEALGHMAGPLALAKLPDVVGNPAVRAAASGAGKAATGEVRPLLNKFSLVHPLRMAPQAFDSAKNIIQGGKEGLADLRARDLVQPGRNVQPIPRPEPPEFKPVPTALPPRNLQPQPGPPAMPPGLARVPVWAGKTEGVMPAARGTAENPIQSVTALPSGRVSGKPSFDTETGQNVTPIGHGEFTAPMTGEELGIHGGVENTPIPTAQVPHPPFAPDVHKSPATVARQLKGTGTQAEGVETPPEPSKTMKARLEETGAMPIARQLKKSLEKGK